MRTFPSTNRLTLGSLLGVSLVVASLSSAAAPGLASAHRSGVPATQRLAVLLTGHAVHRDPDAQSALTGSVEPRRPITGEQTVLPVVARSTGRNGTHWLKVMLPGRPNSFSGWIASQGTRTAITGWRIVVNLRQRHVSVYRHGELVRRFEAVVGKPSTPTPTGHFFVEETLQMYAGEPGGPFALALSARSNALQEFEGGPGQIAIHGRDALGGVLGDAESHGCMRLATASIDWLAERIGPGVPVRILTG
jgi:lipoprotein-anchoring transpeptidase ErfK/SrfK